MKVIQLILLIMFANCGHIPKDTTPKWAENNRHSVEMSVDCNTSNPSLGLSGCSFKNEISGVLRIKNVFDGSLVFQSPECSDFSLSTSEGQNIEIPLKSIFKTDFGKNCTYRITQSYNKTNKVIFDSVFTGRFFINTLQDNRYYDRLKFGIKENGFIGVGWHQRKAFENDVSILVKPSGKEGTFRMTCDDENIITSKYTSTPFRIDFKEPLKNCDYMMVATNDDRPEIEFGVLMYNIHKNVTLDVINPKVTSSKRTITFEFEEKNGENKEVVFAVSVNDKLCTRSNSCSIKNNTDSYTVRGYTTGGRVFYGIYNAKNKDLRITWNLVALFELLVAMIPLLSQVLRLMTQVLEPLVNLVVLWIEYTKLRQQRIVDAINAENEIKKKAKEEEFLKAKANVNAFKLIETQAWQDRYNTILRYLNESNYHKVIALLNIVDSQEVNTFLFDTNMDNEYKTVKIINIMKRKEK